MNIFLPVFSLLLLGICAFFSSLFFARRGVRIAMIALAASFWASAIILAWTGHEDLTSFLLSDYSLFGQLNQQVMASLVVFGFGWYIFVVLSTKTTTRPSPSQMTFHEKLLCVDGEVRIFKPTKVSMVVWIPAIALMVAIWIPR